MVTLKATAHVGPDGLLRLELPFPQTDLDVKVTLMVEEQAASMPPETKDRWKKHRDAAARDPERWAGIRIPAPGSWNREQPEPILIEGDVSVSEQLIRDRR